MKDYYSKLYQSTLDKAAELMDKGNTQAAMKKYEEANEYLKLFCNSK